MSNERERFSEILDALDRGHGCIDIGRTVLCDFCSTDLTDDKRCGGFLFSRKAVGPCCADEQLAAIRSYNEQCYIKAWCPPGQSFADWVRSLRAGNNTITVTSGG